jgi:hypothetical protein
MRQGCFWNYGFGRTCSSTTAFRAEIPNSKLRRRFGGDRRRNGRRLLQPFRERQRVSISRVSIPGRHVVNRHRR